MDVFKKYRGQENLVIFYNALTRRALVAANPREKLVLKNNGDFEARVLDFAARNEDCLIGGYFSYDLTYPIFGLNARARDDLALPDVFLLAFDSFEELDGVEFSPAGVASGGAFEPEMSEKWYGEAYGKIKDYIKAGDVYQINLTHRLYARSDLAAAELWARIVAANPVGEMAFIGGDGFEVLSASPENFVRIRGREIETSPIKGTRRRGRDAMEDQQLAAELLASEKEAAELNMITDLLRNDIGRIAKIGSVKVAAQRALLECPTVWHTVSKVVGELPEGLSPLAALMAMLPGGSITGCPKKRACEIIDELEPVRRGVYTGSIGYLKPNGDLNFNIAIRTLVKKAEDLYLQVGGGIVLDSGENAEFEETLQKAKSFMKIL